MITPAAALAADPAGRRPVAGGGVRAGPGELIYKINTINNSKTTSNNDDMIIDIGSDNATVLIISMILMITGEPGVGAGGGPRRRRRGQGRRK